MSGLRACVIGHKALSPQAFIEAVSLSLISVLRAQKIPVACFIALGARGGGGGGAEKPRNGLENLQQSKSKPGGFCPVGLVVSRED